MRNRIILGLIFILAFGIQIARAAMLGTAEIIILLVVGILFLGFIFGVIMLIYYLIKKSRSQPQIAPNNVAINFTQPTAYQNPTVEEKVDKKEDVKVNGRIALPQQNEIRYVSPEEIIRCEADNNYTNFFFSDGDQLLISKSLKEYSDLLKPQGFVRSHQSHLVNPKFVKSWLKEDGGTLLMDNGDKIPVSKPNREMVKEVLGK
ncbi:LytTR family DNA-binding domain-containing protein [Pedobacter miscanthi]|uniref:LytR/AlgR family response regulator transcription factor n=1 Tax=Pedobacter miscanthi TaxID=2259170 RepID=UPI00292E1C44|nr:LytTR family DNA-binding domain-containing protein [Pedobacter miscanthi]